MKEKDFSIHEGEVWKHFKGFELTILGFAKHSETLEDMVIYEHDGGTWVRPKEMFIKPDDVSKREDNVTGQKYRFEKLNI